MSPLDYSRPGPHSHTLLVLLFLLSGSARGNQGLPEVLQQEFYFSLCLEGDRSDQLHRGLLIGKLWRLLGNESLIPPGRSTSHTPLDLLYHLPGPAASPPSTCLSSDQKSLPMSYRSGKMARAALQHHLSAIFTSWPGCSRTDLPSRPRTQLAPISASEAGLLCSMTGEHWPEWLARLPPPRT